LVIPDKPEDTTMTPTSFVIAGVAAIAVTAAWLAEPVQAQPYGPGPGYGFGMRGGYGPGYGPDCPRWGMNGPGPRWMHGGRGWGRGPGQGPGWHAPAGDLKLTIDDVKMRFDRWLAWRGNSRLKLGEVKSRDEDTIVADIVTKDNSLVERFAIDRHTGYFQRVGD
jgi:hypothetical protein